MVEKKEIEDKDIGKDFKFKFKEGAFFRLNVPHYLTSHSKQKHIIKYLMYKK